MRETAREARNMRDRRDVDRLGSHLAWPVSLIPPVSHFTYSRSMADRGLFIILLV